MKKKINMLTKFLALKLVLLFFTKFVSCDDIFGCGGFVKSSFTINYSKVEIKLYTKHGSLKYQTDCAPHNGYYLIPLYDKGDYILKIEPPKGWSFQPESVELHVDGTSDPCSRNEDINFQFKGFTLSGQVLSRDGNNGPSDIRLVLHNSKGLKVNDTLSQPGGHYSFPNLLPGRYTLEASHSTWIFENSQESFLVEGDNVVSKKKIVIAGYDVQGSVLSDGMPIQGVHFLLFTSAKTTSKPLYCDTKAVKGFAHDKQKQAYLCHVTSSVSGLFTFPSLPPGDYQLVPFYKGEHIEFDVSPSKLDFTVKEGSVSIRESFLIQGFSVSGWVGTGPKGPNLPDVTVSIDDQLQSRTDKNGVYHLENMRTGTYRLDFKKDLYGFKSVEMNISPNTPRLPDVFAEKFSACGRLAIDEYPLGLERSDRKVVLRSLQDKQQTMVAVQSDGAFCLDVVPGDYEVEVVVSETESNFGLKFVPDRIAFSIINEPFMKIAFRQLRAKVAGKVKCIANCSGLVLTMEPQIQDRPSVKGEVSPEGNFVFEKCLPGEYVLSVNRDDWCFNSKSIRVVVVDKDVLNLQLQQTGFQAAVTLTHASPFKVKYPSGAVHTIDLQLSRNVLCLPESGSYEFLPLGCHLYQKDAFKFDTRAPEDLTLSPVKHLVSGNVLTEMEVPDLKVLVHRSDADEVISLQEPISMEDKMHRYTFSIFALPREELEIKVTSKQLLFRIPEMQLLVEDDCLEGAVQFVGRKGVFLKGSVKPPVANVDIKLYHGDKLRAQATTDEFGLYSVGPLEEDIRAYKVTAEAEGYAFNPATDPGHFQAFQLVNVVVKLISNDTQEPLQGVLVSLTGGKDFRQNTVTKDTGKVTFHGMGPGTYYLRPMLKEYSFDPPYIKIDIDEGKQVYLEVKGIRVAYSVRGVVTSLTGEAEVGVALEAVEEKEGVVEEAVSEGGGDFRIRGLMPGKSYKLRVKPHQSHIERSVPNEIDLKVSDSDITGIRMIVFRPYGQMDVSGSIITTQEILHTIKVRLYRDDQLVHSLSPGGSSFFFLPSLPLDHRSYQLRLETTLPYATALPQTTFVANATFLHLVLKCPDPEPHRPHAEHEMLGSGSAVALPLLVIVAIAVFKHDRIAAMLATGFGGSGAMASPSAAESGRGKKAKPKKIQ